MRPLFARVLTGAPHSRRATLGIRPRLLGAWALGSGMPLLAILGAQLRPGELTTADLQGAVVFLAAIGVAVGALAIVLAARSVADPLEEVRQAFARVRAGDLGAAVAVNDGGDIGLLQAGFNEMVAGLRERQQVRDLFGRHVGEDVATQALQRGTRLGGEVREVSTLFVDIMASTALTEQLDAPEVVALLNAFFSAVVDTVDAEGGWVDKFEGDGALCVFGAPLDQPDHAERALRAARTLRTRLDALRQHHPVLNAGIGVASGAVVAGNIGTEARFEYTVIGEAVHEAARLTEVAKGHEPGVLASATTIEAAGAEAECWRPVGELELRGRSTPTTAYAPRT
jgi:adenylate cyclase